MSIILIFISYLIFELLSLFKALSLNYLVFSIKKFMSNKYVLAELGVRLSIFSKELILN
jgi:hypothetical protein